MTNSGTSENLPLLPLLREADRFLAEKPPARALRQKVLAKIDAKTKKNVGIKRVSLFKPLVVALAVAGFTFLCLDDAPVGNNAALEQPQKTEERRLPTLEPVPNEMISPSPEPVRPSQQSVDDQAPQPVPPMTPKSTLEGPTTPFPSESSDHEPAPRLRFPRKSNPTVWPSATPIPSSASPGKSSILDPLTSPTFGSAPRSETPQLTLPGGGGSGSRTRSTQPSTRLGPKRNDSSPSSGVPGSSNNPDEPDQEAEVHVIGIYEADAGFASVHFARSGPSILVLSAYAATTWTVTVGPDVDIRSIYLLGYEKQKLAAAPDTVVVISTYEQSQEFLGCGYEWPDLDPQSGCETGELLAAIKKRLGMPASSFHGCYAGASFTLSDEGASGSCSGGYPFSGFPW
jgi:hypothetical protein